MDDYEDRRTRRGPSRRRHPGIIDVPEDRPPSKLAQNIIETIARTQRMSVMHQAPLTLEEAARIVDSILKPIREAAADAAAYSLDDEEDDYLDNGADSDHSTENSEHIVHTFRRLAEFGEQ